LLGSPLWVTEHRTIQSAQPVPTIRLYVPSYLPEDTAASTGPRGPHNLLKLCQNRLSRFRENCHIVWGPWAPLPRVTIFAFTKRQ
jgi:hypothetical protein